MNQQHLHDFITRGAKKGGRIGAVVGGGLGAAAFGLPKTHKAKDGSKAPSTTKQRIVRGVVGAGVGAYGGHAAGTVAGAIHHARKVLKGFKPMAAKPANTPDWLKGAKTKAEARRAYHAQARKHHPDLGGHPDAIKKLNAEWEAHEPHFKTAMMAAFADEIEKIASAKIAMGVGALIGGAAGYKMAPNTAVGKAMGVAGGALAGHMVGQGVQAAKQQVWDNPKAYERAQLYGYQPYAGQEPGAPRNW